MVSHGSSGMNADPNEVRAVERVLLDPPESTGPPGSSAFLSSVGVDSNVQPAIEFAGLGTNIPPLHSPPSEVVNGERPDRFWQPIAPKARGSALCQSWLCFSKQPLILKQLVF
jgi:hypothetical protein